MTTRYFFMLLTTGSLCAAAQKGLAQQIPAERMENLRLVSGTVTDKDNGEWIVLCNVSLKGSNISAMTDFDGNFVLDIAQYIDSMDKAVLVFSSIGYDTVEVKLKEHPDHFVKVALTPRNLGVIVQTDKYTEHIIQEPICEGVPPRAIIYAPACKKEPAKVKRRSKSRN